MVIERLSSTPRGNSLFSFGREQLLVLVRRVSNEDAGKLLASAWVCFRGTIDYRAFPQYPTKRSLFSFGRGQLLFLVR